MGALCRYACVRVTHTYSVCVRMYLVLGTPPLPPFMRICRTAENKVTYIITVDDGGDGPTEPKTRRGREVGAHSATLGALWQTKRRLYIGGYAQCMYVIHEPRGPRKQKRYEIVNGTTMNGLGEKDLTPPLTPLPSEHTSHIHTREYAYVYSI